MTGISIIIVNYNVKYFLGQCLQSVFKSKGSLDLEVIVVDNASEDGSVEMIERDFPQVKLISNVQNAGFGKANNQAINIAKYDHSLILNPDTIIEENTLQICADYLNANASVGAIGVKMVDGSGVFLPESKRGLPTLMSSFYKFSGLNKLFPNSPLFNHYYLGHLDETKTQKVEALTGAFFYSRTALLREIGGFDEDYFMYGEDLELSYQVAAMNMELVYLPTTQIIHFKGESTKKLTGSYIKNFYGAMAIYAEKRHKSKSFFWKLLLNLAVFATGAFGVFKRTAFYIFFPLLDWILLFSSAKSFQLFWSEYYYDNINYYDDRSINVFFLAISGIAIFCYYVFGHYDLKYNIRHLLYGFVITSLISLSLYGLLPVDLRFSRVILLALCLFAPLLLYFSRCLYNYFSQGKFGFNANSLKRYAIVGDLDSYDQLSGLTEKYYKEDQLIGRIALKREEATLGDLEEIKEIVDSRQIDELVFCSSNILTSDIFKVMARVGNSTNYKIANNDNSSILGSDSKERAGEWYAYNVKFKINEPFHQRTKRLLDLGFSLLVIPLMPIILFTPNLRGIMANLFSVIVGSKTWLGYNRKDQEIYELPPIKNSVFTVTNKKSQTDIHRDNLWYARNYSTWNEMVNLFNLLVSTHFKNESSGKKN